MLTSRSGHCERRGTITPLAAVSSVVLVAMVAFAVDTGWIAVSEAELQNAADAAALAGAQQLMTNFTLYNLPGQSAMNKSSLANAAITQARTVAKQYAASNGAGNLTTLALADADVEFGFNDGTTYTAYSSGAAYPNTVKIVLRRDGSANGNAPLPLFFGPALGTPTVSFTATASATLYAGNVNSFNGSTSMLPLTFDNQLWNSFMQTGQDPDGHTGTDASGNPILKVYPLTNYAGNFGQLSLDDSHNGTSDINNWVDTGLTSDSLQTLLNNGLLPLSQHAANSWDWNGNTGFRSSMVQTVNGHVGQSFWLPLFQAYNGSANNYQAGVGTGSGYNYDIVAFVPVQIVSTGNGQVAVQPTTLVDSHAVFDPNSLVPAGTSSSPTTTLTTPRLTR